MLPANFKPQSACDLIRLGSAHDGGYLVEPGSLEAARTLLSFGVSDDWRFDEDALKLRPMKLEAFDHTISTKKFARRAFDSLARLSVFFWKPAEAYRSARREVGALVGYRRFFRGDRRHHMIAVGYGGDGSKNFGEILAGFVSAVPVFVKCDIEGSEYRILDQFVEHAEKISGLVIEFHDIDLHRDRIAHFIDAFPLVLAHIHANNYGGRDRQGDPTVIELTFARRPRKTGATCALPHAADAPNNPNAPEIELKFEA